MQVSRVSTFDIIENVKNSKYRHRQSQVSNFSIISSIEPALVCAVSVFGGPSSDRNVTLNFTFLSDSDKVSSLFSSLYISSRRMFSIFHSSVFSVFHSFRYSYPAALSLVASGAVNVKALVTHRFKLEECIKAFETTEKGEGIKVVIQCNREWRFPWNEFKWQL